MLPAFRSCRAILGALLASFLFASRLAAAGPVAFDLPAGDAAKTLRLFTAQSGEQLLYASEDVAGIATNAVHGSYLPWDALSRMVEGKPLVASQDPRTGAFAVSRAPAEPSPAPRAKPTGEQLVQLNPFEVNATPDNSYGALNSNSITRFRTDLETLPVTAEVFTDTFINDVAATSVEEMLMQYGAAGMSTADAGAAGAFSTQPGDATSGAQINLRGLRATVHRDGFLSSTANINGVVGATEPFSVERAEVTKGANSLLYGDVTGGGTINLVSKQARFDSTFGRLDYRIDQYGSKRATLDYGAGNDHVAVRVDLLDEDIKYNRINLGGPVSGGYAQAAVQLPFRSILRVWGQKVAADVVASNNQGNINNFLSSTDPRRNYNLRYLVATNQVADLTTLFPGGLNLANVDSLRGWWKGDWNWDAYTGATLDSMVLPWLSSQVTVSYDDAVKDSPGGPSGLIPAAGLTGSTGNPFPFTAMSLNPSDTLTHTRVFGFRWSLLAENDLFRGTVHSQTLIGGEATHHNGGQSGVAYGYYLSDAKGNILVDPANLNNKEEGRTLLTSSPTLWTSFEHGLVAEPFFRPMTPVIQAINPATGQMAYWARQQRRIISLGLRTSANPLGVDPNSGGGSAQYNVGHTETHAYTIANVTTWFDGRLETLTGLRWLLETDANYGPTSSTIPAPVSKLIYSAGLTYRVVPHLYAFADVSTSYSPGPQPFNPYGVARLSPTGNNPTPDLGLKFDAFDHRMNGSITWAPENTIKNEDVAIDASFVTAINPNGINGQYSAGGAPNSQINADKKSGSIEGRLEFHPTKHWRMNLSASEIDGKILSSSSFAQLYNDQFYTSSGAVTYKDGTPVLVDPNAKNGAATSPLTLAMLNDPASPYYANPDPDSGSITNTTLTKVLKTSDPVHGPIATGVTGLPISAIQYNFTDPLGHKGVITPITAGQDTTGYFHYSFAFTNKYDFDRGWLKGFGVGNTLVGGYQFRSHYYPVYAASQTTSTKFLELNRKLYLRPTTVTADLILSYRFKLPHGLGFVTQLNVKNVLNHYELLFPSQTSGNPTVNNFIYSSSPRQWVWTNALTF